MVWLFEAVIGRAMRNFLEEEFAAKPQVMPEEPVPEPEPVDTSGNAGFADRLKNELSPKPDNREGYQRAVERSLADEQREAAKAIEPEGRGR